MNVTKENSKEERGVRGLCVYCGKAIYDDEKYEILTYDVPAPWQTTYNTGPVHLRCRLPALKRFVKELIKDVATLTWFVEEVIKKEKPHISKKDVKDKKRL